MEFFKERETEAEWVRIALKESEERDAAEAENARAESRAEAGKIRDFELKETLIANSSRNPE